MEVIAVNDTNIIIDLYKIDLLDLFFDSGIKLHTTDLVVSELENKDQGLALQKYIDKGSLQVKTFSGQEMQNLSVFLSEQTSNVSLMDCSVWLYAQENGYTLLTGDRKLRRDAEQKGVTVRGILFVFDLLIDMNLLSYDEAIRKLKVLLDNNVRLPKDACANKIKEWKLLNSNNTSEV